MLPSNNTFGVFSSLFFQLFDSILALPFVDATHSNLISDAVETEIKRIEIFRRVTSRLGFPELVSGWYFAIAAIQYAVNIPCLLPALD